MWDEQRRRRRRADARVSGGGRSMRVQIIGATGIIKWGMR
jgi:hypothetical protein